MIIDNFPSKFDLVASMQNRTEKLLQDVDKLSKMVRFERGHKGRWMRVAENRAKKIIQLNEKLRIARKTLKATQ